jgi:Sec-independent protein secretion pathway component TatC
VSDEPRLPHGIALAWLIAAAVVFWAGVLLAYLLF